MTNSDALTQLEPRDDFIHRHIGPSPEDIDGMLRTLGLDTLETLIEKVVPGYLLLENAGVRKAAPDSPLHASHSERQTIAALREIASENRVLKSFIGCGYSGCEMPGVILRNVLESPGWYTAYTPYQAEISQGRLAAILNFQTMISDLTGLEIAGASLLDEATAAAEAMHLCFSRVNKRKRERMRFWVSRDCHPQTLEVVRTRAAPLGIEVVVGDSGSGGDSGTGGDAGTGGTGASAGDSDKTGASGGVDVDESFFAILLQYPTTNGAVVDHEDFIRRAKERGVLSIVAADLLSLCILRPPGELGADVAVGSAQRFGVPFGFGGPHAAYFATREESKRLIPGRLVGVSVDEGGKPALRLALQTREQHIRREKATSNICTAQVLLAVLASMYAVYHGPQGLRAIATRVHRLTRILALGLEKAGFALKHAAFFDTLAVETKHRDEIIARAAARGMNLRGKLSREGDDHCVGIALDELTTPADIEALLEVITGESSPSIVELDAEVQDVLPSSLLRQSSYLDHPVFNSYHSETEMLRYLRRLQEKDIALNRSMIPLGSCTMKLNSTTEMIPVTWEEFASIHPYAPLEQAQGYLRLIRGLEDMLCSLTGFDACSLQPNAGSQGEYAGLLVIRKYQEKRGEGRRNVCLIPSSAHGTNPASAVLAGLRVVVVKCDSDGNIDLDDLRQKCEKHSNELAALMVTYPSTHGVFEEGIGPICEMVHASGGQVYMDGANLNAIVGVCEPGEFGPDVTHLNLHKTFSIPHGGGGPGVGPICVKSHLAPYLPKHGLAPEAGPETGIDAVAAAPWGSAGILPITWAYIYMMGIDGLGKATRVAILNANYIAKRLEGHFEVLYRGSRGMVAHECILDLRSLKASADVDVSDVAKRLMDFGFHAPTMSWPVAGTLMVEPTESESRGELDRFCDALIRIRQEIRDIEEERIDHQNNPLKNAPHTAEDIAKDDWDRPYSREQAVYPLDWVREDKYWPPVRRVDNLRGDRELVCTCPPLEDYED